MSAISPIPGMERHAVEGAVQPEAYLEARWYAAYTRANHEKLVAEQLAQKSIEHFLPTYESLRRWKDRKMRLQMPLFPGYVFIKFALRERLGVLQVSSLVRLVSFGGQPKALSEEEIVTLRRALEQGLRAEPHPYLAVGRRVRIKSGALAGLEGILLRRRGQWRVVLSVRPIMSSMVVEVGAEDIARE